MRRARHRTVQGPGRAVSVAACGEAGSSAGGPRAARNPRPSVRVHPGRPGASACPLLLPPPMGTGERRRVDVSTPHDCDSPMAHPIRLLPAGVGAILTGAPSQPRRPHPFRGIPAAALTAHRGELLQPPPADQCTQAIVDQQGLRVDVEVRLPSLGPHRVPQDRGAFADQQVCPVLCNTESFPYLVLRCPIQHLGENCDGGLLRHGQQHLLQSSDPLNPKTGFSSPPVTAHTFSLCGREALVVYGCLAETGLDISTGPEATTRVQPQ